MAEVRARVAGIVLSRKFEEGADVKAGQVLFQIDPAPYQAAVDSAKATLAKAQANLTQAKELATRYKPLADARAISSQEYVNAQAAQAQAEADIAAAQAALRTAQLNLGYASVTAPISGRIGRALVTEGALVSATEATQLALIQQIDPVYINSQQAVADVARLRKAANAAAPAPSAKVWARSIIQTIACSISSSLTRINSFSICHIMACGSEKPEPVPKPSAMVRFAAVTSRRSRHDS